MKVEPQQQHRWLEKLVGEWSYSSECVMGPDEPVITVTGSERVRSVGGLWTIADGPSFTGDGTAKYQDVITFISDDHRTLTSRILGPDGQ